MSERRTVRTMPRLVLVVVVVILVAVAYLAIGAPGIGGQVYAERVPLKSP